MTDFQLACEGSDPDWPDRARVLAHGVGTEQVPRQGDLLDLIANDPRKDDEYLAFLYWCKHEANPTDGVVSINWVRRRLTNQYGLLIEPRRYSTFWRRARLDGHLERTGAWEMNTDTKGRNSGKQQMIYRWVGGSDA